MNDDQIRLSDLVAEYVRHHEVSTQEAAYDLHELIENLYRECAARLGSSMPDHVFWVGEAKSSQRSKKGYELDFGGLRKFFKALIDSPEGGSPLLNCFCRAENDYTSIPAGVVYLSKSALVEWVMASGLEPPDFILGGNTEECLGDSEDPTGFKGKELVSIRMIVSGLIELIREVHNAHTEPASDDKARKRAENIIRCASRLNNPRKNYNLYPDIISLAEVAGVDMRKPKTLKWYAEDQ